MVAYWVQAGAIALSLVWPGPLGFALGSLLLGLPFTAITFYALQEARRVWPAARRQFPGLLTAAYGIGQIVGPPMVAWMLHHAATQGQGFVYGLAVAAAALGVGAVVYAAAGAGRWPAAAERSRRAGRPGRWTAVLVVAATGASGRVSFRAGAVLAIGAGPGSAVPWWRPAIERTSDSPRPTPPARSLAPGRR